jgi:acetyl-CoA carboxylase biotin carboxylase subunit
MEMNTRIQVEHPVTEELTGVDLIKAQIAVAAGEPLPIRQEDVKMSGHAIECRINAEDPNRDFQPSPGLITYFHSPGGPGLRVESHVYTGYRVPPYYDSMIIKIIAHGVDRTEAIRRMRRALNECVVEGIATTMPFHLAVLDDPAFQRGETHTGFIPEMIERAQARAAEEAAAEASTAAAGEGTEPELEAEAVAGSGEPAA